MSVSQNGWSVFTSPPSGEIPEFVTGRVRPEDVDTVFTYLCKRLDQVETIRKSWTWGWAFRAIRGQTTGFSNHASATAIDVNAPAHPLGVTGTWSSSQKEKIHEILKDLDGVVRWGEDYDGRKDGMHFEINASADRVHAVAHKIRHRQMPDQKPDWKPDLSKAVNFGRVQEQFLIAVGADKGKIERRNGVGRIQKALNRVFDTNLDVDGFVGPATLKAWGRWEAKHGGLGRPRVPDRISVDELQEAAGFDMTGYDWDD